MPETLLSPSNILIFGRIVNDLKIVTGGDHTPFVGPRAGGNRELESQLVSDSSKIARIYSFSYEGAYYDLPRPALFLVHGDGEDVTEEGGRKKISVARAPGEPSLTGVVAADFQFADGIKAWSYDKADHTIRLDVETGEFEDVLLNMFFDGGGPSVSGSRVSGSRVSGSRVSGSRVSGSRLSGGRGDASD
jgi:hypothetical protein